MSRIGLSPSGNGEVVDPHSLGHRGARPDVGSDQELVELHRRMGARPQQHIVVINHHLYFSDLALKEDGFGEILPEADVLVFDEAHQLPDIASHFYCQQVSQRQVETLCHDCIDAEVAEAAESKSLQKASDKLKKCAADFCLALQSFPQKAEWARIQNAPPIQQVIEKLRLKRTLEP